MHDSSFEKSTIEGILGITFTPQNYVRILLGGEEAFQRIFNSIATARDIICLEFYIFKNDTTGRRLVELLKEKVRQGVKVYILCDHYGSYLRTPQGFWQDMKEAGINLRTAHPFKWSSPKRYIHRDHKKLLLIDGQKVFTGGFNIGDEYHGYFPHRRFVPNLRSRKNTWRDTGIYLEGPVAHALLEIFNRSWRAWGGEPIIYEQKIEAAVSGVPVIPIFASSAKGRRKMRKLFFYSIDNAKESIFLTTAYFSPSLRLLKALEDAVRRGAKVKLLLPGRSDIPAVDYTGRYFYTKLLKAGIEIYNYQGRILHAKTAVFDGFWSIIGSANIDFQSFRRNDEGNVGILDRDFGRKVIEVFEEDLRHSIKIEPDTWARRPFYEKLLEWFFSLFRKIL